MKMQVWAAALLATAVTTMAGDPIRPITNPTLVDSPDVGTSIHPIFIQMTHPKTLDTTLGQVPVDGDLQVYAVQLELKLADNLSLIAVKDGYIDFNPDATLTPDEGWADLAAGLKYVFLREEGLVASAKATVELPTGNDDVWQGNGDGAVDPAVSVMKQAGKWQFNGTVGGIIALDDERSSMLYDSWHVSVEALPNLFPLVELNHMRVLDEGDGGVRFKNQADGAVPSIARFEAGDLVNFGASNAKDNEDFVSLALGARYRTCKAATIGAAYEFPLTDDDATLMDYRITVDITCNL